MFWIIPLFGDTRVEFLTSIISLRFLTIYLLFLSSHTNIFTDIDILQWSYVQRHLASSRLNFTLFFDIIFSPRKYSNYLCPFVVLIKHQSLLLYLFTYLLYILLLTIYLFVWTFCQIPRFTHFQMYLKNKIKINTIKRNQLPTSFLFHTHKQIKFVVLKVFILIHI